MSNESLTDLFEEGLKEIYYVEHQLVDALEELADDVEDEELRSSFEEHRDETETHIERLEEVFEQIETSPEQAECHAVDGLIEDHDEFANSVTDQNVHELFDLAAAQKSEHLEIAAYGNLTFIADQLGHQESADLLEENLREEEDALNELKEQTEEYDVSSVPQEQ
ncbi:YciE/YciF ferroxidase family protein [Haladaptatus caseinilyticus]|uniref:YciE/YciF ferroxidase family protein n=1 Tax=Haladaptatus caseinilyticus TaxID=2993314 RepID=UPI00224AF7C6|nr:DUF892 family protein [Haladaptatus caseinilyticus]